MNKVLVTGTAIGFDAGVCEACDYDLDWLVNYPSILLWTDEVLVTETVWKTLGEEKDPRLTEVAKACKLIFDIARDRGIIKIIEPKPFLSKDLSGDIRAQVENDIKKIIKLFPDRVSVKSLSKSGNGGPTETIIDGTGFCEPYLGSVYASLILARKFDANCLFNPHAVRFLRYKFGTDDFPAQADMNRNEVFATIFESQFPNESLIPYFAFESKKKCKECRKKIACRDGYLKEVETKTKDLLKIRDHDEIHQVKKVIDQIIKKRDSSAGLIDPKEIAKEFEEKKDSFAKKIHLIFPKVKRWANVATIISIPLAIAGLSANSLLATLSGATSVGLAQLGKSYMEILESKYRWISFIENSPKQH